MPPVWLKTLFQKWQVTRGSRLSQAERPFSYDWPTLLEESGLRHVEDQRAAERDLANLKASGKLDFVAHKYRKYLIQRVKVPLDSESWLMEIFDHTPAAQLHQESLAIVKTLQQRSHSLYPELWDRWCELLRTTFQNEKNLQPLTWKDPGKVRQFMTLLHDFTSTAWPEGTKVRHVCTELGLGSKELEELQARFESCLTSFFERPVTLESCGIVLSEPKAQVAGKLTLHFADGTRQDIHEIKGVYTLPLLPDLERAIRISTSASRLLSVENSKTTLPALASKNHAGDTLLAACSFPNRAVIRLIELLPSDLPLYHFGDTDPAGFLILSTLRQKTGRVIHPFLMEPKPAHTPVPFTEYDLKILSRLLTDPSLADIRPSIERIAERQDKGLFEQESLGSPDLEGWPFYSASVLA